MRRIVLGVVVALLLAACGGGSDADDAVSPSTSSASQSPKATLGIITTEIETALGNAAFAEASQGQQLDVGDRVRTDETGFAEITYHDGSWQRVEAEATLTILALSADASVNEVRTGHDIGRTWNNVQELDDPDDIYELRTPVGTAAVRGTRFATDCETDDNCTFTVLEGTVRLTPITGAPLTLTAGQALTITDDGPRGDPVDADTTDPWITKNQDLDDEREGAAAPSEPGGPATLTVPACDVFSADEAQYLAEAREDGRATGPFEERDSGAFADCLWEQAGIPPDGGGDMEVGLVQLHLSTTSSFDDCGPLDDRVTSSGEPIDGVGDEAVWYKAERTLVAFQDGFCVDLGHTDSDAGIGGRERFADAVARILTRVTTTVSTPQDPTTGPPPKTGIGVL